MGWQGILYGRIYVDFYFLIVHKVCTKARLLGERSVRIREVVGSNPIRSTIRSTVILIELRWIFLLLRRQLSAKMKYAYARIIRAPVHRRKRLEQIALGGKKANVLSRIIC